jgi:hypothetical protein
MERSNSSIDMVNTLGVSLCFSFPVEMSKAITQMVGSGSKVCTVNGSNGSTRVVDQLTEGSGGKAR